MVFGERNEPVGRVMAVPSPDAKIQSLGFALRRRLKEALELDNAWRTVADCMNLIGSGRLRVSSADDLLGVLVAHECTVAALCRYLRVCQLYGVLPLLAEEEAVQITRQPDADGSSVSVQLGKAWRLCCEAKGVPGPCYAWYCDNKQLAGQTSSQLVLHNFTLEQQGSYYCVVSQGGRTPLTVHSQEVEVSLAPIPPHIEVQPERTVCQFNSTDVILECRARGHPAPRYQWYHNNTLLQHCTSPQLKIPYVSDKDEGKYRCLVENTAGELFSETCTLKTFKTSPDDIYNSLVPKVSVKVALLIGNTNYLKRQSLNTPWRDVMTLASILTNKGFMVIALKDLTLIEMRSALRLFCQLLCKASYGVFYFAGHGFELNRQYMMPVEAGDMRPRSCMAVREVVHCAQKMMPHLILVIADMCLTTSSKKKQDQVEDFKLSLDKNILTVCSTTSGHSAYEREGEYNGVFMESLKKYLPQDVPIDKVLQDVLLEMPGEQSPTVISNVYRRYYLGVPVEGNQQVEDSYKRLTTVREKHTLCFPEVQLDCLVSYHPLYDCFHNALVLVFRGIDKQRWYMRCEVPALQELVVVHEEAAPLHTAVIHNLQKAKLLRTSQLSLQVTVKLFERRGDVCKQVSNVILDVGYPLVTTADLWHDAPSCSCEECDTQRSRK